MSDKCQQPGCTGTYAADGYCDECGHKAPAATSVGPPAGGPSVGLPAGTPSVTGVSPITGMSVTGAGLSGVSTGTGASTRSRTAGRGGLGANLVVIPPVPPRDPATAVLADPQVPESHRFCGNCGKP